MWNFKRNKDKYRVITYSDFDSRRLITDVVLQSPDGKISMKAKGLWDTGGRMSTITNRIINALRLKQNPEIVMLVNTSAGEHYSHLYPIALNFNDAVVKIDALSTDRLIDDVDIILGMDVITKGDLSITNIGGKTEMIFRLPTQGHINA